MTEPRLHHVTCANPKGLHRMAYWEWGAQDNPRVVVCAHGLSRQGRDFDTLAQALSADFRVICPDVVGRGRSDWLPDPMLYAVPTYVADMVALLARLNVEQVSWVGTSMGGLIGLSLASLHAQGQVSPISRLVLNDVGPVIEFASLQRIGTYLGAPMRFPSVEAGAEFLWSISQSFGPHTPEQWLALSRPQFKPAPEGGWMFQYDPAIAVPFRAFTPEIAAFSEAMLWKAYDSVTVPTLLVRGQDSDLLSADTARAMGQRGPQAPCVEFAGVGHAPTLIADDQVACVREFLLA
ncbi:alpha/beta hydrolase [Sphaerotilus montanus]|uniref:Pimeloyl-ACP methyl ester carboxylesterase n=1 Tax=Sphaerotilus montanus TaxID=522889 RepID=A0A7Y9R2E4_9BURK|nr:alpha/beta hydrolase [Sphaerotilus montanus]NYG34951.1 pimeloyl-ACP methyl ester carboxylesterase [Sphaerotilus montanus]NZD55453.1 alpha/beta hydrolase [Sphaerotilus montanus]